MKEHGRLSALSDSAALVAASVINGVAAYVYIAIGARWFGAAAFAPVSILWTIWALTVAVVTFPIQHWTIRSIVSGDESHVRSALVKVSFIVVGFAVAVFLATALLRETLFGQTSLAMPIVAGLIVIEAAVLGLGRGILSGRAQFKRAAAVVGGENVLRLVAGVIVVVAGWSATAYGAALLFGLLVLLFIPSSLRLGAPAGVPGRSAVGELGGIAGGTLVAQIILMGQPLAVALLGGKPTTVTAAFATTAVFRAPYLVALSVALRSMHRLAELSKDRPERLERIIGGLALWGVAISIAAGLVGTWLGPMIVSAVFGPDAALSGLATGFIIFGSTMALVSLGLTLILIAQEATHGISISWVAAAALGLMPVLMTADPVAGVASGFAAAETIAVALLSWFALRSLRLLPR